MMRPRCLDDEIWYWYEMIQKFKASGIHSKADFCKQHDISYNKFMNMIYKIEYKSESDPTAYEELALIGREYLDLGLRNAGEFSGSMGIKRTEFNDTVAHLKYLDIIDRIKLERGDSPMNFIPVKAKPTLQPAQGEIIEAQNDIEIIIQKGVKVSISPNIDSLKIIRIIELLKDL